MKEDAHILIVDDDPRILHAQATILERAGYHVFKASGGQDALRLAREMQPDLVLLDVVLPDIDGVEICRRIKADPALDQPFVILLSGVRTRSDEQAEGLEAGADGMIARPIANRELLARVEAFLRIRRAEQKRRASEARYRDIFENAPIGLYRTTPEGEIMMVNPALVDMLGYESFEELAQRDLESEGYHPDYPRSAFKRRIEEEGRVTGLEAAWQRKDGSTLFVRENARAVYDADGRLVAYQGTVEDVTERVQRTKRIERLNTVLDAIGDVNQLIVRERDRDELIAGACRRLVETRGYRMAWIALLGEDGSPFHTAQASPEGCVPVTVEGLRELCEDEALLQADVWVADAADVCQPADVYRDDSLMAIRLEHAGVVHGLMAVSLPPKIDIDAREKALFREVAGDIAFALHSIRLEEEHRRADRALEESERRQSLVLNATVEMFAYYNTDLEIQWVNQAAADSVGLSREALVGCHCYEVWAQRQEPCEGCPVLKALRTGKPQQTEQTTPDGRVWFVRGYPVFDEEPGGHGEIEGLVEFSQEITEQKAAEEALRESEERYRVLFERTGAATVVFGDDGVIRMCNEEFMALAGLLREEIEGRMRWSDFVADEDLERMEGYHAQRSEGSGSPPADYEFTFVDAKGERKQIYLQIGLVRKTGGRVVSLTDVTPLKRAEEALRESEERYHALFESAPEAVALIDLEGTVVDCNPVTERIAELPREEIIGKPFMALGFLDADDLERYREIFSRLLNGERVEPLEVKTRHDNGQVRWLEAFPAPISKDGEVHAIQVIARDVTERKMAEEARERLLEVSRQQAQRLQQTIETVPEGVLLLDADHRVILSNPVAERDLEVLTQIQTGDVLTDLGGRPLEDFLTPSPSKRGWQEVEADGCSFEVIARPMTIDGGRERWVMVINDTTIERQVQEQLYQQERLAAVGQLAGGIAHDFNNLLASIILYAQMPLREADLAPRTKHALETILEESHRAADLIQQILDFSRSAMMETEPLSLVALVEETLTLLRRTIPEHVRLATEMTRHPCIIQADATRIHQVLMNLALNARDAMPEGGELRVEVGRVALEPGEEPPGPDMPPGAWARLRVSDTGTGLSEEAQEHLFEPFFTTKEEGEGTGLGLAQVYGIVKQHEGFIDVDTAAGEGTTFDVFLPLVRDDYDGEAAEGEEVPPRGRGETVLVVEDAERLRQAIKAGLEMVGFQVITAANGREALEAVSEHKVDVVLTDVVMPHMGGKALLQRLRAEKPGLRMIAMTGHVMETDVQELRAAGFAEALPKPFSVEDLTRVMREVLDG